MIKAMTQAVMITLLSVAAGSAGNANAATIINPPSAGEGDTVGIINALFPDYIRLGDSFDQNFEHYTGSFVLAWEDNANGTGDFDYNDLIVHITLSNGVLLDWYEVDRYSNASQNFTLLNTGIAMDSTGIGTVYSVPGLNPDGLDHLVTWSKQGVPDVPEPATMLMLGGGLLFLAWRWRKRV
jgi:hypothetical protein